MIESLKKCNRIKREKWSIIIDKRMRMQEKQYLKRFEVRLIELPPQNSVYAITKYQDTQIAHKLTKINEVVFGKQNVLLNHKRNHDFKEGRRKVGYEYPEDVKI